jgi:hypothetical protein
VEDKGICQLKFKIYVRKKEKKNFGLLREHVLLDMYV